MSTTHDFDEWLSCIDLSDYKDVYSLYHSVEELSDYSSFNTIQGRKEGQYFVSSSECDDKLMLSSEKARQCFLSIIEDKYCEGMDIEGYYAYHQAMEKDD